MKKLMLWTALILLLFISCSENQKSPHSIESKSNAYQAKIDSLLETFSKNGDFMGSLALLHDGETIYANTVGFSDIETRTRSNVDTKYLIGSISKTFTAVLIFKAVEESKMRLDQTLEKYFPNVKNASKITIAHLLQHRSGIYNFTKDKKFSDYRTQHKSSSEMIGMISNYRGEFEPDNRGEYSNSNYYLLAQILERIYDLSYDKLLQKKICTPLKLKDTYSGNKLKVNESSSYTFSTKWNKFPETNMSVAIGTGSIVSTPTEVNKFMNALFTGELVSNENLRKIKSIRDNYGMGISRYKINDREGYGHRGQIDGFRSTSIYFPNEKLSFTLTSNASRIDINNLYSEILKLYFDDAIIEISETEVKILAGVYVSEQDTSNKVVFTQSKNILIHIIKNEYEEPLVYKGNNRFVFEQMYAESISFSFSPDGKRLTLEQGDYQGKFIKK